MFVYSFANLLVQTLVRMSRAARVAGYAGLLMAFVFSISAHADDTEIFFAEAAGSVETYPNILFILDNSGSMRGSKLASMKVAMNHIIDNVTDVNLGMMNFTWPAGGGTLVYPVTNINDPGVRQGMKDVVNGMRAETGTPIVAAMYEAAMALTGGPIEYSRSNYTSPMVGECQNNFMVVLSDGYAYGSRAQRSIRNLIGQPRCDAAPRRDEVCGVDLAEWMEATDHSALDNVQNIRTYTIGFNNSDSFLQRLADAGDGAYYEASTTDQLIEVFTDIIGEAADANTTLVAPATSINQFNRLTLDSHLYFSLFKPQASPEWIGNLKRYTLGEHNGSIAILDDDGSPAIDAATGFFREDARSAWSASKDGEKVALGGAANQLEFPLNQAASGRRKMFTNLEPASSDGMSSSGASAGDSDSLSGVKTYDITFDVSNGYHYEVHPNNLQIMPQDVGLPASSSDAELLARLNWIRGLDVKDEDEDGVVNEYRQHMGDPLHASPVVLNYGSPSSSVRNIFVSTNDGVLHAINNSDGSEVYSFIPDDLLRVQNVLYNNVREVIHPYGLDGDMTLWHVDNDNNGHVNGSEKAYLYVGMRRGGREYYAFDVSSPNTLKLMWKIRGGVGEYAKLGQTWSKPIKTKIMHNGTVKDVLIFAGGYSPDQDPEHNHVRNTDSYGNAIFIADALTGQEIWTAEQGNFDDLVYSIPSDLRVLDIDSDGLTDRIYVGDMGGQLWRFDIN